MKAAAASAAGFRAFVGIEHRDRESISRFSALLPGTPVQEGFCLRVKGKSEGTPFLF